MIIPLSLKSSTSTISAISSGGERLRTLCTVRRREDHPSLWNGIITLVFGSFSRYSLFLQLDIDRVSQKAAPQTHQHFHINYHQVTKLILYSSN